MEPGPPGSNVADGFAFAPGQWFTLGASGVALRSEFTVDVWFRTPFATGSPSIRALLRDVAGLSHVAVQVLSAGSARLGVHDEVSLGFLPSGIDVHADLSPGWHRLTVTAF